MTKGELIKALEGLDDNARIFVQTYGVQSDIDYCLDILDVTDKVTGDNVENEITLLVG